MRRLQRALRAVLIAAALVPMFASAQSYPSHSDKTPWVTEGSCSRTNCNIKAVERMS
ncbi:MAG: hypothetical protein V4540_05925 [Pseudomonadota bacterium]